MKRTLSVVDWRWTLSGSGPWNDPMQRYSNPAIVELSFHAPTLIHTGMSGKFEAARAGANPSTPNAISRQARPAARNAPPRTSRMVDMDHSRLVPVCTLALTARGAGVTTRAGRLTPLGMAGGGGAGEVARGRGDG